MINVCSVITALTFFFMPAQTTLYSPDLDKIVELPASYFLMQVSADAPDGYIAVAYDDLNGYVKKSAVSAVDYTPVTKYEKTAKFACDNDGQPVNLRAAPVKTAEILAVMPSTATGRVYGNIDGEALISGAGDTWYYVNYNGIRGYCYYAHVRADAPPPNIIEKEQDTPVTGEPVDGDTDPDDEPQSIPVYAAIILIVALCIPVPFIMFYLFRKPKSDSENDDNT